MSQYYDILTAVQTLATSLLTPTQCVIRKRPFHSTEHGDPLPMLCISPTVEHIAEHQMQNGVWVDYPVQITFFQIKDGALQSPTELALQLSTRETIRQAFSKPSLSDVSTVMNYKYDPGPSFDLAGLDQLYDISCQQFTFRNNETRSV